MNILHVTLGYLPAVAWGGPVQVVHTNSLELLRRGHAVTVCSSNLMDKHQRIATGTFERNIEGVRAVYLNAYLLAQWPGTVGPTLLTLPALRRLWREVNAADVVHIHGTRNMVVLAGAYFAQRKQKPLVVQPHGTLQRIVTSIRLKGIYDSLFTGIFVNGAQRIIALTPSERRQIVNAGAQPELIEIVPNGRNAAALNSDEMRCCFRQQFGIGPEERVILFLGRINRKKGTDLLVKAYASLSPTERSGTRLVIAGPDDGQLDEVQRLVRSYDLGKQVLFTGLLAGDDVAAAFVDADIFVLPCRTDTFPVAILEACEAGTPMVVTDTCEIAHMLEGIAAEVVAVDAVEIAQGLRRLLNDPDRRARYGEGGRELIRGKFSVSGVVDQLETIYKEAIECP